MLSAFKTRYFQRWMQKTNLTDHDLRRALQEMSQGLIDADLGGGVVKKRIGVAGRGKSNGVRTLVATNKSDRWFFVFGFAKKPSGEHCNSRTGGLTVLGYRPIGSYPSTTGRRHSRRIVTGDTS